MAEVRHEAPWRTRRRTSGQQVDRPASSLDNRSHVLEFAINGVDGGVPAGPRPRRSIISSVNR